MDNVRHILLPTNRIETMQKQGHAAKYCSMRELILIAPGRSTMMSLSSSASSTVCQDSMIASLP